MLNIDGSVVNSPPADYGPPVLRMGFRPFFLVAGISSVVLMAVWMASYFFAVEFEFSGMSAMRWHAHEMIFGYTMAVIAGFLLTAIKNWTGIEVLRGWKLAFLFLLWLLPRLLPLSGLSVPLGYIAFIDIAFLVLLVIACLRPVIMVKQYKQIGIVSKLSLLIGCHVVFYLGLTGDLQYGVEWGLYSALYIILGLMLVMIRRVMPMFIRNGVDGEVALKNRAWLDNSSLVLLLCLWVSDVFTAYTKLTATLALLLAVLHLVRLSGWYTGKLWSKPLLWVLVLAYVFIILGFSLKAVPLIYPVSSFIAWHAFTVGGIGLLTIGMMSRVALGHTGRNVFDPPAILFWIFLTVLLAAIVRVIFPLLNMALYSWWIAVSQGLWIIGFSVFVMVYAPMLLTARVDGRDG
jgi:uncharacterized protein involved in response to NO